MMEIVERVAAKMAKQAECNHERKATGFGYACRGHYGAYAYCVACDKTWREATRLRGFDLASEPSITTIYFVTWGKNGVERRIIPFHEFYRE